MLLAIAEEAPFFPNITKLSKLINVDRNTFLTYLRFLDDAALIRNVYADSIGISRMQKPEKIFLENTNIPYAMGCKRPSADNIYTTFIANQLSVGHKLTIHDSGDLMIDGEIRIVVGSQKNPDKTKSVTQYFAQENLEYGYGNTIPIWMFGLLY
jgi:predicted AAA+ superfamily ATPase